MGNNNLCIAKQAIDEANMNLDLKVPNEKAEEEGEIDLNCQKARYQMLYDKRKPINSIPSNNISMEIYDDKLYLPQPPEGIQKRNKPKPNANDDYIIDVDNDIYEELDDKTYVNTKDKLSHKKMENGKLTKANTPMNQKDFNDKLIKVELTNEMNKTSTSNNKTDLNEKRLSSMLDKTQQSTRDLQKKCYFSIDNISKEIIALYQISIKESKALSQVKLLSMNDLRAKTGMGNSCVTNRELDVLFQSDMNKVTPKTLKLISNYCLATKDYFYLYKSKESFLFQLNPQYMIKFDSNTKVGRVALVKSPKNPAGNQALKYFLLSSGQYSFVFAFTNKVLYMKWYSLLRHLTTIQGLTPQ